MRVNVIGFEISQGVSKTNGKPYAIGKLHVVLPISNGDFSKREGNAAKGAMGHTYPIEVPLLDKVKHLAPPFVAEASMEDVITFGNVKQTITSLVPTERSTDARPASQGREVAKA